MRRTSCAAPGKAAALVVSAVCLPCFFEAPEADAQVFYAPREAEWRYFPGVEEASQPDTTLWRQIDFDDSGWASGAAPFGYGSRVGTIGTDLSRLTPPMRNRYTSLFLRRRFDLSDPERLVVLQAEIDYDDGFVLWINGVEVARSNVGGQPGDPVAFDDVATASHTPGRYETLVLTEAKEHLVPGTNVIAVQGFNRSRGSGDFKIDVAIVDPLGPDLLSPSVERVLPFPGARVPRLPRVEVFFSEDVEGVDAADLELQGVGASGVERGEGDSYLFHFAVSAAPGDVEARWVADHGIVDAAGNPLRAAAWSYTVDPEAPEIDVVLNEFLASNASGTLDEDRERSDWIEVLNRTGVPVDLEGWGLTDDADEPFKWTFPARILQPGELLLVFASGKDRRDPAANLHTTFKLNASGEYLGLFRPDSPEQALMEYAPRYPEQRRDISYGLDGSDTPSYFETPSPRRANGPPSMIEGILTEPLFSVHHGLFDAPFTLELTSPAAQAATYYTLDGSEPTPQNGMLYEGPLDVAGTPERAVATVRAVAYQDGFLPSSVVTRTYIFPQHVLSQSNAPAGFPRRWGSAPGVDYEMDPVVVEASSDELPGALRALPSLSVVMAIDDLFGAGGLYSNPQGEGVRWERGGSAELIFPDGRRGFQINCGVRIHGGASRRPERSPKHSIRLLFKGAYGPTKLRFPFLEGSPVATFDTLVFRANYNNSWIHWDSGQRRRGTMIRDQWARDTQLAMSGVAPRGTYVHMYLNGLYWGVYNPTERPSAPFGASYYGGEKAEYDALNSGQVTDGDTRAWSAMRGLAGQAARDLDRYRELQGRLDIPHFVDYLLMNFYGSNADWPNHNWYSLARRDPPGPWRFFSWDAERILEGVSANRTGVSDGNSPGEIYARLRPNAEFRLEFADRVRRHLFDGGALTPEAAAARWERRRDELRDGVLGEEARWGDYRRDVHQSQNGPYEFYRRSSHWFPEHTRLLTTYFPRRTAILLGQLGRLGLYPRVGAPTFNQPGGQIEPGFVLELSPPDVGDGAIYLTLDGTDPRVFGSGEVSATATAYSGPLVLDDRTVVKARYLEGDVWSALTEGLFTVVTPRAALRISEIMYNPPGDRPPGAPPGDRRGEFIELHNVSEVSVDLGGLHFTDGVEFAFADGASLGPGEYLVIAADPQEFAALHPGVPLGGVYDGRLSNGGEELTVRDAAERTVLSVDYDDGDFWPLGPDGLGWSLVLGDPRADPEEASAWRASAERGGSPGAADPEPPPGGVLINEVLTRSTAPLEDAVELHNPTDRPLDIGGWFLSDSRADEVGLVKYRIPRGTVIPAGGYTVFYENQFNDPPDAATSFALDGDGDDIYLAAADAEGNLTGYVVGHELGAALEGVSLGRFMTSVGPEFGFLSRRTLGVDDPTSVAEFRTGSGAENAGARVDLAVINEIHYHPAAGVEFVEIHNRGDSTLELHDAAVGRGWRVRGLRTADGTDVFEFGPGTSVAPGGYLVIAPVDGAAFRSLRVVPDGVPVVGPYRGGLANGGERLELQRPVSRQGELSYVAVDRVRYNDRDPWPETPDGGGPSLERAVAGEYGNDPLNWDASGAPGGTPGASNSVSAPGFNRPPRARFTAE
ncbi:MAG: lamin tail domain-containing protein, partial [Planctomycetota bacterium]|nr:lamin tail domain-containing protein [Planctomycetota bacterium]